MFENWHREVFAGFDANTVAKMEEKEIVEIASNKALSLADSRVMCIVDNAKCITKASTQVTQHIFNKMFFSNWMNQIIF